MQTQASRRSLLGLLAATALLVSGCRCPQFLNKNCSLRVAFELEPKEINQGYDLDVAVVLGRAGADIEGQIPNSLAWFGGGTQEALGSQSRYAGLSQIRFAVEDGEIRYDPDSTLGSRIKVTPPDEDDPTLRVEFRDLGNPRENGRYDRCFVFADYLPRGDEPRRGDGRLEVTQADIQDRNWKVRVLIGADELMLLPAN